MKSTMAVHLLLSYLFVLISCTAPERSENTAEDTVATATTVVTDLEEGPVDSKYPLHTLRLPEGFRISVYAEVDNARSMAMGMDGTLFVGNRRGDKVYALRDEDKDNFAEKKYIIAEGLIMPNGVAVKDGDLYVAELSRILKFSSIESRLADPPKAKVIYDQLPDKRHHGWKYIAFGPDGKLYVPVGAPCNICESEDKVFAAINRMNADGTDFEVYAEGVRNTVGFTWHPQTKELWFTDNGRDMMGDNFPPCELNRVPKKGMHFGYPYCHGKDIGDPEFGTKFPCTDFSPAVQPLGPHVAPLGLKFYTGSMFPEAYRDNVFIAEHGSWNRSKKIGYRVSMVGLKGNTPTGYETFISGWLNESKQEAWGRPVDVLIREDGSMLLSDDKAGLIYRISYTN